MNLKYVMFDDCLPVLFGGYLQHKDIKVEGHRATSAGSVTINGNDVSVGGQSISLNLKPVEGDAEIIKAALKQ